MDEPLKPPVENRKGIFTRRSCLAVIIGTIAGVIICPQISFYRFFSEDLKILPTWTPTPTSTPTPTPSPTATPVPLTQILHLDNLNSENLVPVIAVVSLVLVGIIAFRNRERIKVYIEKKLRRKGGKKCIIRLREK